VVGAGTDSRVPVRVQVVVVRAARTVVPLVSASRQLVAVKPVGVATSLSRKLPLSSGGSSMPLFVLMAYVIRNPRVVEGGWYLFRPEIVDIPV